ncbi:sigma-70 family RNA polymerase sigma factor [bacterium]|nr:sigma-70 family RNA polymerase sigma factor [bacterium]
MNRNKDDLELARDGDRDAFWRLVAPHRGLIFATALGMLKDPEAAEDLLHETLLAAARSIGSLREAPCLPGWLHTMTRNLALDMIRRQRRRRKVMAEAAREARVVPSDEWVQKEAWLTTMEAAIDELPEPFRVVLALKYMNEYSYEQIAEVLGISLGAVRSRLFEARKLLKQKTESLAQAREVDHHGS